MQLIKQANYTKPPRLDSFNLSPRYARVRAYWFTWCYVLIARPYIWVNSLGQHMGAFIQNFEVPSMKHANIFLTFNTFLYLLLKMQWQHFLSFTTVQTLVNCWTRGEELPTRFWMAIIRTPVTSSGRFSGSSNVWSPALLKIAPIRKGSPSMLSGALKFQRFGTQSYYNNIEGACKIIFLWSHSELLENLLDASDIYCLEIATTLSLTGNANYFC